MMNPLGDCQHKAMQANATPCGGPLCVSSGKDGIKIVCERCGNEAPADHPMHKEITEVPKPSAPPREVMAMDYPATVPDRVKILEAEMARMKARLEAVEARPSVVAPSPSSRKKE